MTNFSKLGITMCVVGRGCKVCSFLVPCYCLHCTIRIHCHCHPQQQYVDCKEPNLNTKAASIPDADLKFGTSLQSRSCCYGLDYTEVASVSELQEVLNSGSTTGVKRAKQETRKPHNFHWLTLIQRDCGNVLSAPAQYFYYIIPRKYKIKDFESNSSVFF